MRTPVALPTSLDGVLDALEELPEATLLAGGTDLMVQINFGERSPRGVIALRRVTDLRGWTDQKDTFRLGPMLTYRELQQELASALPALAAASRTVGSPPIRNRGTIGGNLATASPAGDLLPVLLALGASVGVTSGDRKLLIPLEEFLKGPKRTALGPTDVIDRVLVPKVSGPQHFLKMGPRNAMVISVASLALVMDQDERRVRCGLGSVGPTALRPVRAEQFLTERIDWPAMAVAEADITEFARLAALEASPITDKRGTDEYRRHCIEVLASRAVRRSVALER